MKAGYWLATAAFLLAALLTPQTAHAWPKYEKDFSARLSVDQSYTDNLLSLTAEGDEEFITVVRPGFSLAANSDQNGLKLDYDFGYSRYWRLEGDFLEHNGRGSVWQQWEHLRFDMTGAFSRAEYPIELSPKTGAIIGLRNTVAPYYRADATPGLSYVFGEERSIRAGYNYSTYWSNDASFQNSEMKSPNVSLTYGLNKFNVLNLGYTYEQGDFTRVTLFNTPNYKSHRANGGFTHRFTPHLDATVAYAFSNWTSDMASDTASGYRTHQATLGTNYSPFENLTLSFSAGYYLINQQNVQHEGPAITGAITKKFSTGEVSLSGDYGTGEDYFTSENLGIYEYWNGRIAASHQLTERLTADASGNYGSSHYLRGRTDNYWGASTGLSWLVRPWLSARASYSHTDYRSKAAETFIGQIWDFAINTYLVSLTATYE